MIFETHERIRDYVKSFQEHQQLVREHLNGDFGEPCSSSFVSRRSYWTSKEKGLFFHGLSSYSRHRPDLIAAHVKTKSTLEVCTYLHLLQEANSRVDTEKYPPYTRQIWEPAMDVSDDWVTYEEEMAQALIHFDVCPWSLGDIEQGGSRASRQCTCPSPVNANLEDEHTDLPNSANDPSSSRVSASRSDTVDSHRQYLNHLDRTCLNVLENFILANEKAELEAQLATTSAQSQEPRTMTVEERTTTVEDGGGQWRLLRLASSPPSQDPGGSGSQPTVLLETGTSGDTEVPVAGESTAATASIPVRPDPVTELQERIERNRLRKRLWMRRQRAKAQGTVADESLEKLPPGRKLKERKPPKPRAKTYKPRLKTLQKAQALEEESKRQASEETSREPSPESEEGQDGSSDDEVKQDEEMYEPVRGGMRRPGKLKKEFEENGIDHQLLVERGLNFFHLSEISRLFRMYNSLDETRPLKALSLSPDFLQLLRKITDEFVSSVVLSVILAKETANKTKGPLKVWRRIGEEITPDDILECLPTLGLDEISKKEYFQRFVRESGIQEDFPAPVVNSPVPTFCVNKNEISIPMSSWNPSIFGQDDHDELAEDEDEEALQKELEEDMRMDIDEVKASSLYERGLRRSFNFKRKR